MIIYYYIMFFLVAINNLKLMDHAPLTAFLSIAEVEELYMSLMPLDSLASQPPLTQVAARMIRNC